MAEMFIKNLIAFVNYILHSNIINFAIMVWFFAWIFKKFDIMAKLGNSINQVKETIEKSDYDRHKSEAIYNEVKDSFETVDSEISELKKESDARCSVLKDRISKSASSKIELLKKNSDKILKIEEDNKSKELTNYAVSSSVSTAKDKLIQKLSQNTDLHSKFIDQSILDFERLEV